MIRFKSMLLFMAILCPFGVAGAQAANWCADLGHIRIDGVEITKAAMTPTGTTVPPAFSGAPTIGPLPAHCRVDGVINRRKGADGEEFGIGFALALPQASAWNGDFMMQGGGGGNGVVSYPLGASFAGDKPALVRGFAVARTVPPLPNSALMSPRPLPRKTSSVRPKNWDSGRKTCPPL